ncbi:MAG: DUF2339 domain-containing protein [Bacteroidota bacterium]
MSTLVPVLLFAIGAVVTALAFGASEVETLLAAVVGGLFGLRMRDAQRLRRLERQLEDPPTRTARSPSSPLPESEPTEPPRPDRSTAQAPRRPRRPRRRPEARPRAERPPAERTASGPAEGSMEATVRDGLRRAMAFVTGGNLVARVSLLLVFVAVGLFIRYAAQQGLFPIEVRLLATSAVGAALLATGWRVRSKSEAFALTLQGGGVAVLYLTIYASYALYDLLPPFVALVLMAIVAAGCAALAVIQNAPALALIGVLGGFMAPVLAGSDSGNHVLLFSYYTALNLGVLGIAWIKGWRSLALLGFGCTFIIGGLWGGLTYRPELYATTQPFLIVFFAIYFALAIHFARRAIRAETPPERVLVVDGTLVFGLPAATFVLQRGLVETMPYGDAWSASILAGIYLVVTIWLYRAGPSLRLLADAFLAVGLVFATLALPLAFNRVLVGALWVLEGAALVWTGARQRKAWMRWGGLALQLVAAAVLFRQGVLDPDEAFGPETLTGWIVAIALGLSAYVLHRYRSNTWAWERLASHGLLIAGLLWWGASGFVHALELVPDDRQLAALVGFAALSSAGLLLGGRALDWSAMRLSAFGLIPVGFTLWLAGLIDAGHLFADGGWLAWPAALGVAVFALAINRHTRPRLHTVATATTAWLIALVLATELGWLGGRGELGSGWAPAGVGLVFAGALAGSLRVPGDLLNRVTSRTGLGLAAAGVTGALAIWILAIASVPGGADPLPYLPVLNPLGLASLAGLGSLVVFAAWLARPTLKAAIWGLAGIFGFIGLTLEVARSVHQLDSVAFDIDPLFNSATFQAALAISWTVLSLVLTIVAVRQESRPMWFFGAAVLALVVLKLFFVDLSRADSLVRIAAFFAVGLLGLWIAYKAPLPPRREFPDVEPRPPSTDIVDDPDPATDLDP